MQQELEPGGLRTALLVVIVINAAIELTLGGALAIGPATTVEAAFRVPFTQDMMSLALGVAANLIHATIVLALAFVWVRQGKREGAILCLGVSTFLLLFGLLSLWHRGDYGGLIFDGIRGVLTAALALALLQRSR